jgi:hypothetical protein
MCRVPLDAKQIPSPNQAKTTHAAISGVEAIQVFFDSPFEYLLYITFIATV